MIIYIIAIVAYLALFVASLIGLFFQKSRKLAKVSLSTFAVITLIAIFFGYQYLQPLSFKRTYLESHNNKSSIEHTQGANQQVNRQQLSLKELSQQANIYIGAAPRNMAQMTTPIFKQTFNSITPENALKLGDLLDIDTLKYNFKQADEIVNNALKNNLRVRGHALIFGKLSDVYKSPDLEQWLGQFSQPSRAEKLQKLLDDHFNIVLNHYRGKILEWDVINEPLGMFSNGELEENVFLRHLSKNYIAQAFITANAIDPNLTLYMNEQFYNYTDERAEAFYQLVVSLLNEGVPINGVGLQGHMLFYLATPEETSNYIKRFTQLGLTVQLTEFEARLRLFKDADDPYQAQGEYYRDIARACYKIKGFNGITFWGVTDKNSWMNDLPWLFPKPNEPYLIDQNQQPKPGLRLIKEWIEND